MEGIVRTASEHPLVAGAVCFAVLLIVYFLFKSLVKLALILLIVAVAIGGYFYFKHPESSPANFKDAVEKALTGAGKAVDQGKETFEKGREMAEKAKELLGTGIEKGKEAVEKGSDTAGKIGKVLKGEKEDGDRRSP